MPRNRLLLVFILAGLILALVLGVYFYNAAKIPSAEDVRELLSEFTGKIAAGELAAARELMTEGTRELLRDPGTDLGRVVYRDLTLTSVDNVYWGSDQNITADVVFTTPDTLKIMTRAGLLFAESVTENGPAEDADQAMAEIYAEILAREDLPMLGQFCIVRMTYADGTLRIIGDASLQHALEGGSAESLSVINNIVGSK